MSYRYRVPMCLIVWLGVAMFASHAQGGDEFDLPPIRYSSSVANDAVAKLKGQLQTGEVVFHWDKNYGYLPSLLEALRISPESQVLVFSKTSLQIHRISPSNPRAIYFNDSVYVGYVPGSDTLELSVSDPQLGAVFYTLDSNRDNPALELEATESADGSIRLPRIVRDQGQCLSCHATTRTESVPGHLMRSIFSDRSGHARSGSASYSVNQRTPFEQRWGGWYVTGTHGTMRHMGNAFAIDRDNPQTMDRDTGANLQTLPSRVPSGLHLTPHSDLVALMVLSHQVHIHNLITRASFETRQAIHSDKIMNEALGRPIEHRTESTTRRIAAAGKALLSAMLMVDEYPFSSPVAGTSNFANVFANQGPRTTDGRSLRDLDLETKLFRYPLSFLIYTPEFQELPSPMAEFIRTTLRDVLDDRCEDVEFAKIKREDKQALREILSETLPGWID